MSSPEINIEKFVLFHRRRIDLLNRLVKEKTHGRLIFQICFLGIESLAKLLEKGDSKKRFIDLLSKEIGKMEANHLYDFWRCPLTHEGFIANPFTTLEGWDEDDISFLSFPDGLKSSVEYPPESMIAIYKNLISYLEDYFKKTNTKRIILSS